MLLQYLHAPNDEHFQVVKHILWYVKGTLHYGRSLLLTLMLIEVDNLDTRRSTSGYSIYLSDNLVPWSAKKQPMVPRSNCESEYRALASTVVDVLWLDHLLRDLQSLV